MNFFYLVQEKVEKKIEVFYFSHMIMQKVREKTIYGMISF